MTRDLGLEALLEEDLAAVEGLTGAIMFGGRCWLLHGNLLCAARTDGLLVRLGRANCDWALGKPGIAPMVMGKRQMYGWVRLAPCACGDDDLRQELIAAALAFVRTLPAK